MKQFRTTLLTLVTELNLLPDEVKIEDVHTINYTLGVRYLENGILYLYHDDVIKLFVRILDNAKFRRLFSQKYPIILIDEYQDSFRSITDQFIKWFIEPQVGPQFGFFGDSWQTIYSSNGACGLLSHPNLIEIKKVSNFRSQSIIVDVLNKIRPELPQISAINDTDGKIYVVIANDYTGARQTGYYKGELPVDILKKI